MNNIAKLGIVIALAAAVAATVALKQRRAPSPDQPVAPPTLVTNKLPKLLELGATKCVPCKLMAPILEELRREQAGRLEVVFIDVWENEGAGKPYSIEAIPTQIFYNAAGKELFRHTGFFSKDDILAKWKEFDVNLPVGAPVKPAATRQ